MDAKEKNNNLDTMTIITTFGLVGVTLGFVMGTAIHKFIRSLSEKIVMPVLGSFLHINDFQGASFSLNGNKVEYGEVILTIIDVTVIFLIVYVLLVYVFKPHILDIKREQEKPHKVSKEQNEEIITKLSSVNENLEDLKDKYNIINGSF